MQKTHDSLINQKGFSSCISVNVAESNLQSLSDNGFNSKSILIETNTEEVLKNNTKEKRGKEKKIQTINATENFVVNNSEVKSAIEITQELKNKSSGFLFRLFIKNGEYVYARPDDIVMMESCDHLVKVYLGISDKIKLTIRNGTLKDFLLELPQPKFIRISRFCAVNIARLSGGNFNDQILEFDFKISVKLKHSVHRSVLANIGT